MLNLQNFAQLLTVAAALGGFYIWLRKLADGTRCQLRSEMLRIYYHNRDAGRIRQYEWENFAMLYAAYKALSGNSFIDHIHEEIQEWEVIS